MTFVLSQEDHRRLHRWQRRMVGFFVATWVYLSLVIAADIFLEPPTRIVQLALVPVLALVIGGGFLQFSARCPSCGYRIGRQSGLVVPAHCRACGASLRPPKAAA